MDWNDLKFFLAVANARSLSAASRHLKVSISTVSRRITALEESLGVMLFRHHSDGYELTEAGKMLVIPAEQAVAGLTLFERTAKGSIREISGLVRIDVPELLGQQILVPGLASFMEEYPDIQLDIHSSVRPVSLATQQSDIIIRLVRPERGCYKIRKIGEIAFGFYAHPNYLQLYGMPTSIKDLSSHRIIDWSDDLGFLVMSRWINEIISDRVPSIKLSSFTSQLMAAESALGIALLPAFAANKAELIPVLHDIPVLKMDLWLLVQEQLAHHPRIKLVKEFLIKSLNDHYCPD